MPNIHRKDINCLLQIVSKHIHEERKRIRESGLTLNDSFMVDRFKSDLENRNEPFRKGSD